MRILIWNILHGGGPTRLPEIALAILAHAPDLVLLSEFRVARGGQLRAILADQGLEHQLATSPHHRSGNGLLTASRWPIAPIDDGITHPKWLSAMVLDGPHQGLCLLHTHIPDESQPTARAMLWQWCVDAARRLADRPALLAGDLNTDRPGLDTNRIGRTCVSMLGLMTTLGWRDLWRDLHPGIRETSWSGRGPDGRVESARLDTALLSPALASTIESHQRTPPLAEYSQNEWETGLSDHAPLVLTLPSRA